jgi:acyl phosphate:glycerol-3-phosphate acyltransferase
MMLLQNWLPWLGLGYLLGSIPFGLLLTRAAGLGDIRQIGSGNIGATNVLRTGNKALAAATLLLDAIKGAVAVLLARSFGPPDMITALVAGVAAFAGHVFPLWLRFRGGKGVATFLGTLLALEPALAAIFAGLWLMLLALFRMSSLSALTGALLTTLAAWAYGAPLGLAVVLMTLIILIRHHENIARLLKGSEPKVALASVKQG